MTNNDWINLQPAFSALLGALVGGLCAIYGVYVTHKNNLKEHDIKEKKEVDNYLKAILAEVSTIWEWYEKEYKPSLENINKTGDFINQFYPIKQDYFTVYDNNTNLLGKVEKSDLRKNIVITYTQAKSLIDSILCNNETLEKYNRSVWVSTQEKSNAIDGAILAFKKELLDYAPKIKEQSDELEKSVKKLIKSLDSYSL